MAEKLYVGFYTHKPFWAGKSIFEVLPQQNWEEQFTNLMSEIVFEHETESYSLKVCRDGLFLFQLAGFANRMNNEPIGLIEPPDLAKLWTEYLVYLNAILILFESAFLQVQRTEYFDGLEITIKDAFSVTYDNGKWMGHGVPKLSVAQQFQMARFLSSYRKNWPLSLDPRLDKRATVINDVFQKLFYEYDIAFRNISMIHALAKLAKSLGEYKIANYDTSLVISWFIIESFLTNKWMTWLKSRNVEYANNNKRINRKRYDFFTGREFPISVISNMLELTDNLPNELFKQIDKIRRVRNKIVHASGEHPNICDPKECVSALEVTSELIGSQLGFKIHLNLVRFVSSLA